MTSPSPTEHTGLLQTKEGLQDRFRRLAHEWREQSRYLSNNAQIAMLRPYQRIIGMGMPAVPLILEELRSEPDQSTTHVSKRGARGTSSISRSAGAARP